MNDKYTYEVTDTGQYFYENDVRIFPDQFWKIIKKLEHKIEELDFELKQCKERKLYSRRELERENTELKQENINLKKALRDAEEDYIYEAYYDNPIRKEAKLKEFEEDFKREYWNE